MDLLRDIAIQMYERILALARNSSPATLQLSGILGLALVLIGYFHMRGGNNNSSGRQQPRSDGDQRVAGGPDASPSNQQQPGASSSKATFSSAHGNTQQAFSTRNDSAVARAVRTRLQGVRRVTLSCPGVLLQPGQLHESASLCPEAAEVVQEMCHIGLEVFLVSLVADDIGEALISGAMESAGVSGSSKGQVPPHRVLFCSTLEGKVAIVRQLEPELHVDGLFTTVDDLRRFIPSLWHVKGAEGSGKDPASAANVQKGASLAAFFGQTSPATPGNGTRS